MSVEPNAGQPQGPIVSLEADAAPNALDRGTAGPVPVQTVVRRPGGHRRPEPLPSALSAAPNALGLLKALRRRWLLAVSTGLLLAAGLGAATYFLAPPAKHTVRTLIHIPPLRPWFGRTAEVIPEINNHQRTQVAMMKSRLVLNAALRDPKVARLQTITEQIDPVEWLEKEVQADFSVAPEVLRIVMAGERPEELVILVDALREAYLKEIVGREANQRRERLAKLRELREKTEDQIRTSRENQKAIEKKAGAGARDGAVRALMLNYQQMYLATVERELIQSETQLRRFRLELESAQAREKKLKDELIPEAVVDAKVGEHPGVRKLVLEVQGLEQAIDRNLALATRGEDEPIIQQLRQKRKLARADLDALRKRLRSEVTAALREAAGAQLSGNIALLQAKIAGLEGNAKYLQPEAERMRNRVQELAKNGTKLDDLRDDLTQIEDLNKRIAAEESALNVELDAPKREHVLEPAVVTHARSKSRQVMMAVGAAVAGFALVLLGVAFVEFRARRVNTVDEVALGLGMAVVGALPDSTRRVSRRRLPGGASADHYGHALLTESVDATRTMLLHAARLEGVQVVMITSAMPGEGKTSLTSHLAASMARTGLKTLLIDGDLRNPTAHKLFELPNEAGFCDLLRGEAVAPDVIQPTAISGLSLMPAGEWDGQAALGLAQNRTRAILNQLRREYDFILLDSSPVLPVADALLIGQSADAAVFSLLRDVSRLPNVYVASQRLTSLGIRTLGAVVNGVAGELSLSSYKYVSAAPNTAPATA